MKKHEIYYAEDFGFYLYIADVETFGGMTGVFIVHESEGDHNADMFFVWYADFDLEMMNLTKIEKINKNSNEDIITMLSNFFPLQSIYNVLKILCDGGLCRNQGQRDIMSIYTRFRQMRIDDQFNIEGR